MSPDDPRHGKPRGYRLHLEHNEPMCDPCARAWYRYNKRATYLREVGQSLRVSAIGTHRRIRALQRLGYGLPELAAELGIATGNLSYKMRQPYVARTTHDAVSALYERLAMLSPPEGWIAERTRNIAIKRGWPAPLAWDDIDDPDEVPNHIEIASKDIDHAVVWRVLNGEVLPTNTAERREIMRRWLALGRSEKSLCDRMGWHDGRYSPSTVSTDPVSALGSVRDPSDNFRDEREAS